MKSQRTFYHNRNHSSSDFNARSMNVNDGVSYPPYQIEKWCMEILHNPLTSDEERACAVDIYGQYFVNPLAELNGSMKYFMRKGTRDDIAYLYRDRESGTYRIIANRRYCDIELTAAEKAKFEKVLNELYISCEFQKI